MDAEHLADIVFGEDPALADLFRAAQGFLGRLEDEQDIVIKFFDRVDVFPEGEHHGHVAVVTAGVHPAGMGGYRSHMH